MLVSGVNILEDWNYDQKVMMLFEISGQNHLIDMGANIGLVVCPSLSRVSTNGYN
jgi:hypothetical protein